MKSERFIELICHPEKIQGDDLRELDTLVNRYPYFQTARVLYLRALYTSASARFRNEFKSSTVHLSDHRQFYRYLNNQIEFDSLFQHSLEKKSALSDIVDERIREIQGHLEVNSYGIPAYKEIPHFENDPDDDVIRFDLSEPISHEEENRIPPRKINKPAPLPDDSNVVSNPIILDNIPGIIDDYNSSEEQYTSTSPKVHYEVIEHRHSEPYVIEPVKPAPTPAPAPEKKKEENTPVASAFSPLELVIDEEEKETQSLTESITEEIPEIISNTYILKEKEETSASPRTEPPVLKQTPPAKQAPENVRQAPKKRNKKDEIIDRFIQTAPAMPKITEVKTELKDLSKETNFNTEELFSETLAKIYVKQQLYEKAIATYIKLSLKYPEKSVYFADRIEKIRENINNKE